MNVKVNLPFGRLRFKFSHPSIDAFKRHDIACRAVEFSYTYIYIHLFFFFLLFFILSSLPVESKSEIHTIFNFNFLLPSNYPHSLKFQFEYKKKNGK